MALTMFGLLLVSYTLMSADRYLISMLGTDIRAALGLTLPQMGALTTMFTLGIGIAGLPSGALIARTCRRTVVLLGVALFSLATLLFTQATGSFSMFALIVLQGVGMSFLVTAMFALSASYFSSGRVAALGVVNVCFGLGSFVGPWAVGNIRTAPAPGKRRCWLRRDGIVIAILIALRSVRGSPRAGTARWRLGRRAEGLESQHLIFSVLSALYGLTVYGFLGLYPTFLRDVMKFTPAEVGGIMPFFGLGSLMAFFGGQLGDKFSTKIVVSTSSLVLVVLGFFLYLPDLSPWTYKLMALGVGIFGAAIVYTNLAGGHLKVLPQPREQRLEHVRVERLRRWRARRVPDGCARSELGLERGRPDSGVADLVDRRHSRVRRTNERPVAIAMTR